MDEFEHFVRRYITDKQFRLCVEEDPEMTLSPAIDLQWFASNRPRLNSTATLVRSSGIRHLQERFVRLLECLGGDRSARLVEQYFDSNVVEFEANFDAMEDAFYNWASLNVEHEGDAALWLCHDRARELAQRQLREPNIPRVAWVVFGQGVYSHRELVEKLMSDATQSSCHVYFADTARRIVKSITVNPRLAARYFENVL